MRVDKVRGVCYYFACEENRVRLRGMCVRGCHDTGEQGMTLEEVRLVPAPRRVVAGQDVLRLKRAFSVRSVEGLPWLSLIHI